MKKLKVLSTCLLIVSVGLFIAFQMYSKVVKDNTPPVVTCETEELTVSVDATEEDLFEGVTAMDNRSGDVTDTLVIEELSSFTEEGTRVITYAAVDESKNVGRCERILKYRDYKQPEFVLTDALCYAMGSNVNVFENISAESSLDGELVRNIKYTLKKTINTMEEGSYPIEFRVMDSGGKTVYLNTEIEILSREYLAIDVELKEYLIYLKKGSSFQPEDYYEGAEREGELTIESNVNVDEPGTYVVDYIVQGSGIAGKSRLLVVIQE